MSDDLVPVPLPVTCPHGVVVAWRYSGDPQREDRRLAGSCSLCPGPTDD